MRNIGNFRRMSQLGFIVLASIAMIALLTGLTMGQSAAQPAAGAKSSQEQVTFTKDVARILQDRCQICHRPNTFAPMSLLTYEETRPWARSIKAKVAAREMPRCAA